MFGCLWILGSVQYKDIFQLNGINTRKQNNLLLVFYSFWGWGLYFAALNIYSTIIEIEIFTTVIEIEIFTTDR